MPTDDRMTVRRRTDNRRLLRKCHVEASKRERGVPLGLMRLSDAQLSKVTLKRAQPRVRMPMRTRKRRGWGLSRACELSVQRTVFGLS